MGLKYHSRVDPAALNESRAKLARLTGAGKKVLDLGCHAGDLARVLVEQGCRVWGVECDPEAAALAREVCVGVIVADLDHFDPHAALGSELFDVVVMGDVLEHLSDPLGVLTVARGLLAEGGCLLLSVPNIAHVSVRLALLRGDFPYAGVGILDRTHRRFFTRGSLERTLLTAGFAAQVWDPVTLAWPEEQLREELERAGLRPEPELLTRLGSPEAAAFQYVVKAFPATVAAHDLTVVLLCPDQDVDLARILSWREACGPRAELRVVMPSAGFNQPAIAASDAWRSIKVFPFPEDAAFGAALRGAAPNPPRGQLLLLEGRLSPEPKLPLALTEALAEIGGDDPKAVYAPVESGAGRTSAWWERTARISARQRDLNLEFYPGFNLGLAGEWLTELPFAPDLPYPWVFVEWLRRAGERKIVIRAVSESLARIDFQPGPGAMLKLYRQYGARLRSLPNTHPWLGQRLLPAVPSLTRRMGLRVRSAGFGLWPRSGHEQFFKRLRDLGLALGAGNG